MLPVTVQTFFRLLHPIVYTEYFLEINLASARELDLAHQLLFKLLHFSIYTSSYSARKCVSFILNAFHHSWKRTKEKSAAIKVVPQKFCLISASIEAFPAQI